MLSSNLHCSQVKVVELSDFDSREEDYRPKRGNKITKKLFLDKLETLQEEESEEELLIGSENWKEMSKSDGKF
eukprot:CAMPEP_0170567862 /NCGR_PEP_ID=MMETSP0211-20121228/80758_1 /TAXON_ID=311385 /ORGANISM="Pseudokeronopsis sp., Strain OXSARD2" /LENGTH=72 /DNA_ID=CAMNT_0010889451 /DNA_START=1265 /DNA_END=1480 /DNA_ORIENTATION=+